MKSIWKYQLSREKEVTHSIPGISAGTVLHVAMQHGELHAWVEVDIYSDEQLRTFRVVGTGHHFNCDSGEIYHGTVMDGDYVWHVFSYQRQA